MAFDSFRDFLIALEKAGELTRIAPPIATELEITELADREMKQPGGGRALLIEKPTVNGQVAPFPVAINAFGSHRRMAMSLGARARARRSCTSLIRFRPPKPGPARDLLPIRQVPCRRHQLASRRPGRPF